MLLGEKREQPGRAGLEVGQSRGLNRSEVFQSLVFNNNKNKLSFKWYLLTTDKEERKEEEEGKGEEDEKTFELCPEEFGRGSICLCLDLPIFSSLDLSVLGYKMGMIVVALLRCSIYLKGFF